MPAMSETLRRVEETPSLQRLTWTLCVSALPLPCLTILLACCCETRTVVQLGCCMQMNVPIKLDYSINQFCSVSPAGTPGTAMSKAIVHEGVGMHGWRRLSVEIETSSLLEEDDSRPQNYAVFMCCTGRQLDVTGSPRAICEAMTAMVRNRGTL
jgi:hypothetical protein